MYIIKQLFLAEIYFGSFRQFPICPNIFGASIGMLIIVKTFFLQRKIDVCIRCIDSTRSLRGNWLRCPIEILLELLAILALPLLVLYLSKFRHISPMGLMVLFFFFFPCDGRKLLFSFCSIYMHLRYGGQLFVP